MLATTFLSVIASRLCSTLDITDFSTSFLAFEKLGYNLIHVSTVSLCTPIRSHAGYNIASLSLYACKNLSANALVYFIIAILNYSLHSIVYIKLHILACAL